MSGARLARIPWLRLAAGTTRDTCVQEQVYTTVVACMHSDLARAHEAW
jgi:hypothetical protein